LACYISRWYTRPKTVTHPGSNRARHALTSFMRRTPLTTKPRRQPSVATVCPISTKFGSMMPKMSLKCMAVKKLQFKIARWLADSHNLLMMQNGSQDLSIVHNHEFALERCSNHQAQFCRDRSYSCKGTAVFLVK